ncbi:hypothetical protein [Metamycoplasma alkalescens]|uniref:Uncharacterized protein n=2 Tax=Metamycoplasma alkalescens TaxID=45363 RepID=N9U0D0_9BACT|nr:hypothetical protein [Metamycoplasma alkalescens]ENY54012.1 Hypothetical protein, predicted transmembrane protein [Metamycoplasma alkalescens 14918]PYF41926.1 hypothetical protein BCF88_1222 [Metamycoplasma alkalescens]SYV90773.1 Uncharacterised protein [Metamycoplasma alkalescens]
MFNKKYKEVVKIFMILHMIFFFWLIAPLIIGILTLKELHKPKLTKDTKVVYGILNLFLCSTVAGIFLLLDIYNEETQKYQNRQQHTSNL